MGTSPNHEPRNGAVARLLVLHTQEGGDTAQNLANYLNNPASQVSYHKVVDDNNTLTVVDDSEAAWCILSANRISLNLCFAGSHSAWTREQWLSHDGMLRRAADVFKAWSAQTGIPLAWVDQAQIANDSCTGLCDHRDWTIGAQDGSHTDVGPGFPRDVFYAYCTGGAVSAPQASAPAPAAPSAPPAKDPSPALPPWTLGAGNYYGNIAGPNESHGGADDAEKAVVKVIQQAFIAMGCVPGVTNWRDGWADGVWENATDDACRTWFATCRGGDPQPNVTQIWSDDYAILNTE